MIYGPNRTICQVLDEMRACLRHLNVFTYRLVRPQLSSLVEETQTLAALYDMQDIKILTEKRAKLKAEVKALKKEREELIVSNEEEIDDELL